MKKSLILSLIIIVAFTFCKKNSSDNGEEEGIIIKVEITNSGSPLSNAQVNLTIERKYIVNDPLNSGPATSSLSSEYPHDDITGPNGTATFTLSSNQAIVSSGSVYVRHIKITAVGFGTLIDEDMDVEVKTGETKTLNYDF